MPEESQYGGLKKWCCLENSSMFLRANPKYTMSSEINKREAERKMNCCFQISGIQRLSLKTYPHLQHRDTERTSATKALCDPIVSQIRAETLRMFDPGQSHEALSPGSDALVPLRCRKQPGWIWAGEPRVTSLICYSSLVGAEVGQSQTARVGRCLRIHAQAWTFKGNRARETGWLSRSLFCKCIPPGLHSS